MSNSTGVIEKISGSIRKSIGAIRKSADAMHARTGTIGDRDRAVRPLIRFSLPTKSSSCISTMVIALLATGAVTLLDAATPRSAAAAELPYQESFTGTNGSDWPTPWFPGSSHVTVWDLSNGRGRLNGDPMFVARMILPGFAASDVEAEVTFEFEDVARQGIGFYVRQNGGTLQEYVPHGQGYAMFLKGNWAWHEDLGLWREIDGIETQFAWGPDPIAGGLQNGVRYRLRFRVTQMDAVTTLLQAKVWPEANSEPANWTIEATDSHPLLQGTLGSFAADIYNHSGFGHIFLDDISIQSFPIVNDVAPSSLDPLRHLVVRPHPVEERAEIDFELVDSSPSWISVLDVQGRLITRSLLAAQNPGSATWTWDARDRAGRALDAGVYFLRLENANATVTRRVVVAR